MQRVSRVAEEAVREYLLALENHEFVIDQQVVNDLLQRFDECEDDPVERVLIAKQLRRAQDRDLLIKEREPDFIEFVAQWAEANDVVADDLHLAVGVPLDVLDRAGLKISDEYRRHLEQSEGQSPDASSSAPAVPADDAPPAAAVATERGSATDRVQQAMGDDPFTISDLVKRTGASRSTVRAILERMGDRLEELEPEGSGGPGRAARRFRLRRS